MSRSAHPRPAVLHSDARTHVRNAAIELANQVKRLGRAQARLAREVAAARETGCSAEEIHASVAAVGFGRPDRARALERFAGMPELMSDALSAPSTRASAPLFSVGSHCFQCDLRLPLAHVGVCPECEGPVLKAHVYPPGVKAP